MRRAAIPTDRVSAFQPSMGLKRPSTRSPLITARISRVHTQDPIAHQELRAYIANILHSSSANGTLSPPFPTSAGSDSDDGHNRRDSSETEAEMEKFQQIIADLQSANADLQEEMDRLILGLGDLIHNIKHRPHLSKADKRLLAAIEPASAGRQPDSLAGPRADPGTAVACVLQHPGALCCTRTSVVEDPSGLAVTVSMETTARATDDAAAHGLLRAEELGALATQAQLSSAVEHLFSRTKAMNAHVRPATEQSRHDELCAVLQSGEIVEAQENPVVSQFGHESFVVRLRDQVTGRDLKALFKPRVEGDADGWHRAPMEWVAYRLNMLLGLDHVPPVAYRTGGISFKTGDREWSYPEGAMMYFVEDARQLRCFPEAQWGTPPVPKDVLLSNTRVLDTLLHNSDRHHGHFLLGRHWCWGAWDESGHNWKGQLQPCLIDHAASLRADADVSMVHENAFRTGPVRCVAAQTYLRLRFLDHKALSAEFRGMLSEEELRGMAKRRDAVLRYLDGLVAEQGYAATVVG